MSRVPFILIDGKRHLWRDILEMRRAQLAAFREERQPTLFPLTLDVRPASQRTVAGRYSEPLLFGE